MKSFSWVGTWIGNQNDTDDATQEILSYPVTVKIWKAEGGLAGEFSYTTREGGCNPDTDARWCPLADLRASETPAGHCLTGRWVSKVSGPIVFHVSRGDDTFYGGWYYKENVYGGWGGTKQ